MDLFTCSVASHIFNRNKGVTGVNYNRNQTFDSEIQDSKCRYIKETNFSTVDCTIKSKELPKYFAIDLDGTFNTSNEDSLNKNMKALKEVIKLGYTPFFCTGRALQTAFSTLPTDFIEKSGYNGFPGIYVNGSFIYDKFGNEILSNFLSYDCVKKIYDYLESRGLLSSSIFYGPNTGLRCCEYTDEFMDVCKRCKYPINDVVDFELILNEHIIAITVYSHDDLLDVEIPGLKKGIDFDVKRPIDNTYDLMPITSNKVDALKILMEHFGEDPSSCGYIGDGITDLEAMKLSNLSFAVNNADDNVKREAKYSVNLTNHEAAVAYILQQVYGITL